MIPPTMNANPNLCFGEKENRTFFSEICKYSLFHDYQDLEEQ